MIKPDFRIEIPKPCRAGWETMEAAEKGRFCGECSKIVIDFTAMSTDEIRTYFLEHTDQRICGHFISSQISRKTGHTEQVLSNLHQQAEKIKYRIPRIAACFAIVSLMMLAGCGDRMEHLDGEVARSSEQIKADSIEAVKKYRESDSMQQLQYEQDKIKEFANPVDSLKN